MFPAGKTVNTSTPLRTDTKETQPGVSTTEVFRIGTGLEKKISSGLPGQVDILNEETTLIYQCTKDKQGTLSVSLLLHLNI